MNSGGGDPAPGEKGFLMGSMFYQVLYSYINFMLELYRGRPASNKGSNF
jgi:hypothetical protein